MAMPFAQRVLWALADFFCGSTADEMIEQYKAESEERRAQLDAFEGLFTAIGVIGAVVTALLFPTSHLF